MNRVRPAAWRRAAGSHRASRQPLPIFLPARRQFTGKVARRLGAREACGARRDRWQGGVVGTIRNIAVGLPVKDGHVLLSEGFDRVRGLAIHRAVGGGIEFGERAEAALRRDFAGSLHPRASPLLGPPDTTRVSVRPRRLARLIRNG